MACCQAVPDTVLYGIPCYVAGDHGEGGSCACTRAPAGAIANGIGGQCASAGQAPTALATAPPETSGRCGNFRKLPAGRTGRLSKPTTPQGAAVETKFGGEGGGGVHALNKTAGYILERNRQRRSGKRASSVPADSGASATCLGGFVFAQKVRQSAAIEPADTTGSGGARGENRIAPDDRRLTVVGRRRADPPCRTISRGIPLPPTNASPRGA